MATSCARRIFVIVSGHQEPAFTVASFATTTTGRRWITPTPVTTPAAGAWPSYRSYATSSPSSTKREPTSHSRSTRSRAVSFPCACCFSMRSGPPPWRRRASSARSSSLSSRSRLVVTWRSRFLGRVLGEPRLDVLDELRRRRARPEELSRAHRLERVHVLPRDDAPSRDEDVAAPFRAQQLEDPRK